MLCSIYHSKCINNIDIVILCPDGDCNLVIIEGGPKGIRKFNHLMLARIPWSEKLAASDTINTEEKQAEEEVDSDEDDDGDGDGEQKKADKTPKTKAYSTGDRSAQIVEDESTNWNSCVLVWQGIIPKRIFTGFKFQVVFIMIH